MVRRLIIIALFLVAYPRARGVVTLASLFSDHMVLQREVKLPVWGWAEPGERIVVTLNNSTEDTITTASGRWEVRFNPMRAGGPYEMTVVDAKSASHPKATLLVVKDIYVGEVWLGSGQSNMEFTVSNDHGRSPYGAMNAEAEMAAANYPLVRMFSVKKVFSETPAKDVTGQWQLATPNSVAYFSAVGYFFSRDLFQDLHVPIGFIASSAGGSTAQAWISPYALQQQADVKYLLDAYAAKKVDWEANEISRTAEYEKAMVEWNVNGKAAKDKWVADNAAGKATTPEPPRPPSLGDPTADQHNPELLYNGMIAGLIPYAIRGVLWYQGESNEGGKNDRVYRGMMQTLIADWRGRWGEGDFPFYFVQLAAFGYQKSAPADYSRVAAVREEQRENLDIPNTAMAVTIDIGDANNIHPKNKQEVGRRLALIARHRVYKENVVDSGPIADSVKIEGSTVRVHFNTANGIDSHGGPAVGFAIAGADRKWVWAAAKISGDSVILSNPDVQAPVAVRYAYADNPPTNLYDRSQPALPAVPFMSDGW